MGYTITGYMQKFLFTPLFRLLLLTIVFAGLFASCGSRQNLVYFSDLPDTVAYKVAMGEVEEPTVQPNDVLRIMVNSLNPETNRLFNTGTIQSVEESRYSTSSEGNVGQQGYLVNADGFISFPVLGQVQVEGLTRDQVRQKMVTLVSEYVKDPIINVRFTNFRVTVVGEVRNPSTFQVPTERINIIEALGLAGDMTEFGKRDNVLLIREIDGERTMVRLNLNDKDALNSPYFYLRQNDVIYVEPSRYRDPSGDRALRIVTAVFAGLTTLGLFLQRIL
ncbi:polysaccharide biosynthesis/export family protein [Parapedobacter lycopersici]|uniref:polysaccharide biosynthesis/export family protein n=1 Tax=Parapedobacter lycopersici TaxID=1864939 RepID=UPI00214D2514|nr:polysaccharide biosynthesis/export family protein [Parapedobacter lycopersici]